MSSKQPEKPDTRVTLVNLDSDTDDQWCVVLFGHIVGSPVGLQRAKELRAWLDEALEEINQALDARRR